MRGAAFRCTAERLGVSQSRVSQVVRTLETKLGDRLVARTSRRVALTPLGESLRDDVGPLVLALRESLRATRTRATAVEGELRIALVSPSAQGPRFGAPPLRSALLTRRDRPGTEARAFLRTAASMRDG